MWIDIFLLALLLHHWACGQTISTNTPVPPLQWINLTKLIQGSSPPPPLRDAAIGYDETSRSIIIFGGQSENGFAQSQTYLLNLQTLTWSKPSPPPNLQLGPPARSLAISGLDLAPSNRNGFVVLGGKGLDGKALSDVWEFDFTNQFWSQIQISPGSPSSRWGASGGIDPRTKPIQDPVVAGPNNTIYLAGGFDNTQLNPLSDLWMLNISGTLSSNLPNSAKGSWELVNIGALPSKSNQAGAVVAQHLAVTGGCNTSAASGNSCAQQDSYIIDASSHSFISPGACPAPRFSPVLTSNFNMFATAFASQVFLLLGTFDTSLWQDNKGLEEGEVAILDTDTGTWARVLPSGDPGTSGKAEFPTPREGAVAVTFQQSLVGQSRNQSADTIVFGGQDASGKYLSEVWLLRAYNGVITPSQMIWSGFGNGQLKTGVDADGSGVSVRYMSQCATRIASITTSTSSARSTTTRNLPTSQTTLAAPVSVTFDISFIHKLFAPLSLILLQIIFLSLRLAPINFSNSAYGNHLLWTVVTVVLGLTAYGIGIASFVLSLTSILEENTGHSTPATNRHLKTGHGIAGLVFFSWLYVLVPALILAPIIFKRLHGIRPQSYYVPSNRDRPNSSLDTSEKLRPTLGHSRSAPQSTHNTSPPSSPRPRTHSWGPSIMWRRSLEGGFSSDSDSITSASPQRGFEVVNRPSRRQTGRRSPSNVEGISGALPAPRNLGEIDWLLRRRSLNAVGELDYVITQAHNAQYSTPDTGDPLVAPATPPEATIFTAILPQPYDIGVHIVMQAGFIGLSVICLIALWSRASRSLFAIFLAWMVAFYVLLIALSLKQNPKYSILSYLLSRTHGNTEMTIPLPRSQEQHNQTGPYIHQPPYRPTRARSLDGHESQGPRSLETDDIDDVIDEDTQQRIIEEEMERREVSIVTVPKRKLWVANPS